MRGFIRILVLSATKNKAKISVIDSGIGIAKNKQTRLFKLFGMIEGNEGLNPMGCGLGLSIANALAFELGGREIELDSDEGEGASFSFYLSLTADTSPSPLDEEDAFSSSQNHLYDVPKELSLFVSVPRLVKSEHSFMKAKPPPPILVVDDAEFNRLVMRKILTSLFLTCDESSSGLQAIIQIQKAYKERGHCYKVILMDLEMPEMDGITATKAVIRMVKDGELPVLPCIVACSAYSSNEDKAMCTEAGMCGYLEKPISKESLRAVLRECM